MAQFDILLLKIKELIQVTRAGGGGTTANDSKLVLDNILLELRNDKFLTETVWYDKTDTTKFYIRKTTVSQDTGTIVISFLNVDGTTASPTTSNLVQSITNGDIEIVSTEYDVITNGTGYSIGDQVEELKLVNTANNTVITIYYNKTLGTTITPTFSSLQLLGKYATPSHIELLSSLSSTLPANTYKSVSMVVMDGSCNITIDGVLISNFPTNYSEVWGNGISTINKAITISTNTTSRVIINLIK